MSRGERTGAGEGAVRAVGWRDVREFARRRLIERVWRPGERIPDEAVLAAELGCSRSTVNRALRALAEDGLLERKRKGGTRVSERRDQRARLAVPLIRHEVEALGARHAHVLRRRALAAPPPDVRARFGVGGRRRLLHLETLHTADGAPYALEERWVDPRAVPAIVDADLARITVNEWLVEHVPLTRGTIAFSADTADAHVAETLGVAPGAAVFVVERTTWLDGTAITWVQLFYGSGHRVEMTL